jgi:hypothetical protein
MNPKKSMWYRIFAIAVLLLSGASTACTPDAGDKLWINRHETGCSNPWDEMDAESPEERVRVYLQLNGIPAFEIRIERRSDGPFCMACTCWNGNVVYVMIRSEDLANARRLGFSASD